MLGFVVNTQFTMASDLSVGIEQDPTEQGNQCWNELLWLSEDQLFWLKKRLTVHEGIDVFEATLL